MAGHDEHRIAPGLRGWLESPPLAAVAPGSLIVSGWAFATGDVLVGLHAIVGSRQYSLQHALERADVAEAYPDEPGAVRSGFSGYVEFGVQRRSRMRLEVRATLASGQSITLFTRRLAVGLPGSHKASPLTVAATRVIERPAVLLSVRSWQAAATLFRRAWLGERVRATRPDPPHLDAFHSGGSSIEFTPLVPPEVSVVVVVWNRAAFTLSCLQALARQGQPLELIVVDNASSDETSELLGRLRGATVLRNARNLGFTLAANLGARAAKADFLLFLNNDAELAPGAITQLLTTARRAGSIGAVGGKLVHPSGRLQEAGSIVWSDGSCAAYGRGSNPDAPEYNFEREVDFCSAALLLTRRDAFEMLGGFDERYQPAYYEDADYCVRLWTNQFSVVYQPNAVAVHQEFGSAPSIGASVELQRGRQPVFAALHQRWLQSQPSQSDGVLVARCHPYDRPSVVVIDDRVPDPRMGAGFPRAAALLNALNTLGYRVTLYVTGEDGRSPARKCFPNVEVVAEGTAGLAPFFRSRFSSPSPYRLAIVSRPHNMQFVKAAVGADLDALGVPCVYDAEAIFSLREIGRERLAGRPLPEIDGQRLIESELDLARGSATVLTVSELERSLFAASGARNVAKLGHAVDVQPTSKSFAERRSILFIGAFSPDSPNDDAASFLCREILPALRAMDGRAPCVIGGARIPTHLKTSTDAEVVWHSDLDDLTPLYDDARVFVAPMRFGAGISLKVIETAARGVPIVCTPLVARQLGWEAGSELLTAESPSEFAKAIANLYENGDLWLKVREAALTRVAHEYSATAFRSALQSALGLARPSPAVAGPRQLPA